MLPLFFSQLLFLSVVLPQVSLFLWSDFFFGLITVGFVVEKKHGEALREAIILCTGFGLLLFCCLLILLVSV